MFIFVILLALLLVLTFVSVIYIAPEPRIPRDISYFLRQRMDQPFVPYTAQNAVTPLKRRARMHIVTLEDRPFPFVALHNKSVEKYCEAMKSLSDHDYKYSYHKTCPSTAAHVHNPYWCKLFSVAALFDSDADYIFWLDSDTVIQDLTFDICEYVLQFDSDAFFAYEENGTLNAGVFVFRKSAYSRALFKEILGLYNSPAFQSDCLSLDGTLKGMWAGTCYEQGELTIHLRRDASHLTIVPSEIFYHECVFKEIVERIFVYHLCGASEERRSKEFSEIIRRYPSFAADK